MDFYVYHGIKKRVSVVKSHVFPKINSYGLSADDFKCYFSNAWRNTLISSKAVVGDVSAALRFRRVKGSFSASACRSNSCYTEPRWCMNICPHHRPEEAEPVSEQTAHSCFHHNLNPVRVGYISGETFVCSELTVSSRPSIFWSVDVALVPSINVCLWNFSFYPFYSPAGKNCAFDRFPILSQLS